MKRFRQKKENEKMLSCMTRPLRGILFDKDGTLLDLESLWRPAAEQTIDAVLRKYCGGSPLLRREMLCSVGISGGKAQPESPLVAGTNGDVALAIRSVLQRHGIPTEETFAGETAGFLTTCAGSEAANVCPTCPGLPELLQKLRARGCVLGLATSDRPESALRHLQQLGIRQEFSFFGTDDGTCRPKPAPDLINAFCSRFGFLPEECAVVGDAPNDMRFAANGGCFGIFVAPGGCDTLPPGAQASVRSLAGLPELLF